MFNGTSKHANRCARQTCIERPQPHSQKECLDRTVTMQPGAEKCNKANLRLKLPVCVRLFGFDDPDFPIIYFCILARCVVVTSCWHTRLRKKVCRMNPRSFVFCLFVVVFLRWRDQLAHTDFTPKAGISSQWLSELRRLWPCIP